MRGRLHWISFVSLLWNHCKHVTYPNTKLKSITRKGWAKRQQVNANKKKLLGDKSPWVSHVSACLRLCFQWFLQSKQPQRQRQCPLQSQGQTLFPTIKDSGSPTKLGGSSSAMQLIERAVQILPGSPHIILWELRPEEGVQEIADILAIAMSNNNKNSLILVSARSMKQWQANLSACRKGKIFRPFSFW